MSMMDIEQEVTVKEITWEISGKNILTPMANFDPVYDDKGMSVSSVPLGNFRSAVRDGINVGANIMVCKNKCTGVKARAPTALQAVESCPYCGHPTKAEGRFLYCTNLRCQEVLIRRIIDFSRRMGIPFLTRKERDGLTNTARKLVEAYGMHWLSDLFELSEQQLDGIYTQSDGITADGIYRYLHNIRIDIEGLLCILDIPFITEKMLHGVCYGCDGKWDLIRHYTEKREMSWALTPAFEKRWYEYFDTHMTETQRIVDQIKVIEPFAWLRSDIKYLYFDFIGEMQMFKNGKHLKEFIERKGGTMVDDPKESCDVVICDFPNMGNNMPKVKKAARRGANIITSRELIGRTRYL